MVLPLLQVIFIQPDSPWLWQQSGLWDPDANQAAQMSAAESQESASLGRAGGGGATIWGHWSSTRGTLWEGP